MLFSYNATLVNCCFRGFICSKIVCRFHIYHKILIQDILRSLVPEKNCIGDAMVWCVEHASCAKEISQCLYESLTLDETPLHKKAFYFTLICNIFNFF